MMAKTPPQCTSQIPHSFCWTQSESANTIVSEQTSNPSHSCKTFFGTHETHNMRPEMMTQIIRKQFFLCNRCACNWKTNSQNYFACNWRSQEVFYGALALHRKPCVTEMPCAIAKLNSRFNKNVCVVILGRGPGSDPLHVGAPGNHSGVFPCWVGVCDAAPRVCDMCMVCCMSVSVLHVCPS